MSLCFLLTDDDTDDREVFAEALKEADPLVTCVTLSNVQETLEYLEDSRSIMPDVIFLDINLPRVNGWDCLMKIKAEPEWAAIPVIMYSTSADERDYKIALDLGAAGLLTKPSDFNVLTKVLAKIVEVVSNRQTSELPGLIRSFSTRLW